MNRFLLSLCACATMAAGAYASDNGWSPAGDRIMSQWGETLDPSSVLPEYPRPIMERESWLNLNGLWEYTIINKGEALPSGEADGEILVPFAVESETPRNSYIQGHSLFLQTGKGKTYCSISEPSTGKPMSG